jgi:hypothetical protein
MKKRPWKKLGVVNAPDLRFTPAILPAALLDKEISHKKHKRLKKG